MRLIRILNSPGLHEIGRDTTYIKWRGIFYVQIGWDMEGRELWGVMVNAENINENLTHIVGNLVSQLRQ